MSAEERCAERAKLAKAVALAISDAHARISLILVQRCGVRPVAVLIGNHVEHEHALQGRQRRPQPKKVGM